MEGLIRQAQATRRKAEMARTDAVRLRRQSVELIKRAQEARIQWIALCERSAIREPRTNRFTKIRRYVILVNAMQVDGRELRRGDIITNELLCVNFRALLEQKLIDGWDYRLSELNSPGDPWCDGRWMG